MEGRAFHVENDQGKSEPRAMFSTDQLKESGHNQNDSLTSIDIQEMERIRLSLQSMLQSSEHFLRDDKISHERPNPGDKIHQAGVEQESFTSIGTSDLLNNYVNTDRKEIGVVSDSTAYDENSDSLRRSRNKYDKSLLLENTLLNESLEKERFKRKHCEQQIKGLQSKLLETQQELAVSVSGERKKDVMINQLDKTLARVVEDWKKHEQGKLDALGKLEERKEQDEQSQQKQQDMLAQFEKDLSQAVQALSKEQERAANAEQEKDTQIAVVLEEINQLLQLLEEEREKSTLLERELQTFEQKAEIAEESRKLLDQEKLSWQQERSELETKIQLITQAHTNDLENERKLAENEKQVAEDSQRVLSAVQKEVQQLTVLLDTCNREKENLKTEMTLLAAKFEAQKTRQDSEHRAELERQLGKNLREVQSQLSRSENEMRTVHKRQIEDLTKRYKSDLEDKLRNFHQQLKERDRKLKESNEEYEETLSKSHNQLVKVSTEREALKNEKHNMVVRLQKMMQSHCEEALSLLVANTANVGSEKTFDDSTWMSRQTPAPVTSASYVGTSRGPPHGSSSSVVYGHHSGMKKSSVAGNESEHQAQYSNQSWAPTQSLDETNDATEHTWIRLPPVTPVAAQTAHVAYSGHAFNDELRGSIVEKSYDVSDHSSPSEESKVEYLPRATLTDAHHHESGEEKGQYTELSPSTTNESLAEQIVEEDQESERPNLPLNLSTDVLKMLQQQQFRQTELNHYVRQLLKKSPSSASVGELPDLAAIKNIASTSVVSDDTSEAIISPLKEHLVKGDKAFRPSNIKHPVTDDPLSISEFANSEQENKKQMAFRKSAATPLKGFRSSKIPVAQTPPNRDNPSGKENPQGKSVLTPEQVGQLARLIQMYQKDSQDDDLPSPQRMFQYLRDVQTRSELFRDETNQTKRQTGKHIQERTKNPNNPLDQPVTLSEPTKKDHETRRKLEVNIPQNKPKEISLSTEPHLMDDGINVGLVQQSFSYNDLRRPARAPLTDQSDLIISRKPENKATKGRKTSTTTTKQSKRSTGKSAWK